MGLTAKQRRFVSEYLIDGNATQAAVRAGYSSGTAGSIGHENLTKPEIASAIAEAQAAQIQAAGITAQRVIEELATVAFSDVRNLLTEAGQLADLPSLPDSVTRAVSSIEVTKQRTQKDGTSVTEEWVSKVRQWDKLRALEMIAKLRGMFPSEKHEHKILHSLEDLVAPISQ